MHIVITFPTAHNSPGGGARSCLQIARHLEKLGASVTLMPVANQPAGILENSSVSVKPIAPSKLHYLLGSLSVAKAIQQLQQTQPIDAVLCWDFEAAFLSRFLRQHNITFGMIAAYPSYQELMNRNQRNRIFARWANNWFRWRPFRAADIVFVSSDYTRQELVDLIGVSCEKIHITYRGIDPVFSLVERSSSTTIISNFIFYGSLAPVKGVFEAIKALGIVAKQGYGDWTLKVAGWGDEAAVKQAAKENGIASHLCLLGTLKPEELVNELTWAHLAILPSQAESFGRSIAEAQAAKLPVISYDTGSIPEVLDAGKTGWVVPALQVEALADAVIDAIDNPLQTIQMGVAGSERVQQLFSWEKTAATILNGLEASQSKLKTYIH